MNEDGLSIAAAKATLCTAAKVLIYFISRLGRIIVRRGCSGSTSSHELATSHLVFAEKTFSIRSPLTLRVRVDRVYDSGPGLILLELKTRSSRKIYPEDIIELSVQRLTVRHSTGRDVCCHGYVLLIHPLRGTQLLHRVQLIAETEVIALVHRRARLLAGQVAPRNPPCKTRCSRCEYRRECHALATNSSVKLKFEPKSPS